MSDSHNSIIDGAAEPEIIYETLAQQVRAPKPEPVYATIEEVGVRPADQAGAVAPGPPIPLYTRQGSDKSVLDYVADRGESLNLPRRPLPPTPAAAPSALQPADYRQMSPLAVADEACVGVPMAAVTAGASPLAVSPAPPVRSDPGAGPSCNESLLDGEDRASPAREPRRSSLPAYDLCARRLDGATSKVSARSDNTFSAPERLPDHTYALHVRMRSDESDFDSHQCADVGGGGWIF